MSAPRVPAGVGVDSNGGPLVDPTQNVKDLFGAATDRQDALREAADTLTQERILHIRDLFEQGIKHQAALDRAEAERLNSIRQVDREEVIKTAAQSQLAVQTLAATQATTAETLRNQVATSAQALANQLATFSTEVNKRLSGLELSSSEGKGKQGVSDPMMEKLMSRMDSLLESRSASSGKSAGSVAMWGYVVAGLGIVLTVLTIAGAIVALSIKSG